MVLNAIELYEKYDGELRQLASALRKQYHRLQHRSYITAFSDVEGELMYMLIRETKPKIAFEISPAVGWSTNYILAALTANRNGVLHSFEMNRETHGKPTEQVIRGNQCSQWDQQRLVVHIGDAQETVPLVNGTIDFLLVDSCHEDWFAKWYIKAVFPRVNGPVMIQDITFVDQLEPSSEAKYVWSWIHQQRVDSTLVGAIELASDIIGLRRGYAERRSLRSNAIVLSLPPILSAHLPELANSPETLILRAKEMATKGESEKADPLLNEAVSCLIGARNRANRHRAICDAGLHYARLGEVDEARRCFERALGIVMQGDLPDRVKGFPELLEFFMLHGSWKLTAQTAAIMLLEPRTWFGFLQKTKLVAPGIFRRIVARCMLK